MPTAARSALILFAVAAAAIGQGSESSRPAGTADYGPYITGTVEIPAPSKQIAMKGVSIRLAGAGGKAMLCFDTDLLRVAGAWVGDVTLPGGRDGIEGQSKAVGPVKFATKPGPGWAGPNGFTDPRAKTQGPLPREWAKWKGIYLHERRVVLSYSVGQAEVLELPASEDGALFARNFAITGSGTLTLLVCEQDGASGAVSGGVATLKAGETAICVGLVGAPAAAALAVDGTRVLLRVPAGGKPFQLAVWSGPVAESAGFPAMLAASKVVDPTPLTKGGPARWKDPISVQGQPGADNAAYTVDTVPVPFDNPWKAYMRLTGIDFFKDGDRCAVSTMDGDVWVVSGLGGALATCTWKRYATGLYQPLDVKIVDDQVYCIGRDQITRLKDLDGDGEADFHENFNNDCPVTANYHEFALGLQTDAQGNFYYNKGSNLGKWSTAFHGCVVKVSKDGSTSEVYATGLRAPNGNGMGPNGEYSSSDNQGNWMPACRLNLVTGPGKFLGMVSTSHRTPDPTDYDKPLCWLPMKSDNSSGGQAWSTTDLWGPFKNRMVHLSYGHCTLFLVVTQDVGGLLQGGVVRFPLAFKSGILRARFHPKDGQLWTVGMKGWQTDAAKTGSLNRVRYTGKPVSMPTSLSVAAGAITIGFTAKLDPESASKAENFSIQHWDYQWTGAYGSPDFKPGSKEKGREPLAVTATKLSADGMSVTLSCAVKPVMQMLITIKAKAADGTPIDYEIANTVHKVP